MQQSQNALTGIIYVQKGNRVNNNAQLVYKLGCTLYLLGHLDEAKQVLENAHQET
jgi:hypothetical protein